MVSFRRGKIKEQMRDGTTKEVSAVLGSNGLAYTKEGSGRRQYFQIHHINSGRVFPRVEFMDRTDAERYINDVSRLADWHAKQPNLSHAQQHELAKIYHDIRPELKSKEERDEEERAKRVEAAKKEIFAARNREDFGHYDYKGGGYTQKGRLVKYDKLNKYEINALNRKGNRIAKAEATGSRAMHQARKRIYNDKRTWLKFSTYNRTRGKFLKG